MSAIARQEVLWLIEELNRHQQASDAAVEDAKRRKLDRTYIARCEGRAQALRICRALVHGLLDGTEQSPK